MDDARTRIQDVLKQYRILNRKLLKERSQLPDGRLIVYESRGKTLFQEARTANGIETRKGITKDKNLVRQLARKAFLEAETRILENNIGQLERALTKTRDLDAASIIGLMRKGCQKLPPALFFNEEAFTIDHRLRGEDKLRMQRHVEWANQPFKQNTKNLQNKDKITSFGLEVRSKSEQLITERLHDYGVPFRYDMLIQLGPDIISPDFTFQDRDMKYFYWEHAGRLDDPRYEQRHNEKLRIYRDAGIVPWNHLMITYEYQNVLNMGLVDAIIQKVIIPRL